MNILSIHKIASIIGVKYSILFNSIKQNFYDITAVSSTRLEKQM